MVFIDGLSLAFLLSHLDRQRIVREFLECVTPTIRIYLRTYIRSLIGEHEIIELSLKLLIASVGILNRLCLQVGFKLIRVAYADRL